MDIGIVGLGKMGANMARRLTRDGHRVVATDLDAAAVRALADEGAAEAADDVADLVAKLPAPAVVWMMVPAGGATDAVMRQALERLSEGDVIVDGANSDWRDSRRRAEEAATAGVRFVDCGVSGGIWGLEEGFNLMVGGDDGAVAVIEPALASLAPEGGWAHLGPSGSGHFVKMVHNGVEYALMQAYGEGFEAMAGFPHAELDLARIAQLWGRGSVIRSWLLELMGSALEKDGRLEGIEAWVDDSGMGRWTVEYGIDQAIPMPAITAALFARFASRGGGAMAAKSAAALRNEFGGHAVREAEEDAVEDVVEGRS